MEILRQKGVRLIAINDDVDSFYREYDFTPPFLGVSWIGKRRKLDKVSIDKGIEEEATLFSFYGEY